MALPRYFDKAAASIASLLRRADYAAVGSRLEAQVIAVRYDADAAATAEGRWTLELLVSLLGRLYPTLMIEPLGSADATLAEDLWARAASINPLIERAVREAPSQSVVVGSTSVETTGPVLYAGSDGWLAKTSSVAPVGSGATQLPYGAGAAACVAAAWVFRNVFRDALPASPACAAEDPDALTLSLLDFRTAAGQSGPTPDTIPIGETHLVGVGAIGNGVVWALARTPGLVGRLYLVDGERIDLTNVQRYVLAHEADEDTHKPKIAAREFAGATGEELPLEVLASDLHWAEHLERRGNYQVDRALLALDSAEARIAAQASLPRWIANSWTQPENLGVSRHEFLGDLPCVACLYLPRGARLNRDQIVAAAVRAEGGEERMEIRRLLHTGQSVGEAFLARIAERLDVDPAALLPFASESLDNFYVRAICGGVLLRLGAEVGSPAEVPMAFQSALAGILLAAELVADACRLRPAPLPARTEFDLLRPPALLGLSPHVPQRKDTTGRCICRDPLYRSAYEAKYRPQA